MFEILYCLDENYNEQTIVSMYSLISKNNVDFKFHIIHENPESFNKSLKSSSKIFDLTNVNIYKFNETNFTFPKVQNSHVSKATYYRLFISDYLPLDIEKIIYIDPDVICLKNILNISNKLFDSLINSEFEISVRTEHLINNSNKKRYDSIEVSDQYFNAGVMFIDFKKWNNNNLKEKFVEKTTEIEEHILFWDQDVMNSYFNGKYLELPIQLNQHPQNFKNSYYFYKENTSLLHFSGKNKPWTKKGKKYKNSKIYHELYQEVFNKKIRYI